jgi:two-component system, cell cycle response regulator CpdR
MGRCVLVVDDDVSLLEAIAQMLRNIGCEVTTAQSGPAALATLEHNPRIEILITDIQMPYMNGYELARRAKDQRPNLRVLVSTGREDNGHGLPVIHKPFGQDELMSVMARTTGLC